MNKIKFSADYVMQVTFSHMIRAVDISIKKTVDRLPHIDGEEGTEALKALSQLSQVKSTLQKQLHDDNT